MKRTGAFFNPARADKLFAGTGHNAQLKGYDVSGKTGTAQVISNQGKERAGKTDKDLRDNGWFVFGVVRDPRPRCFSAWQNKLLLGSPSYTQWRREPWYPRFPDHPEAIREDFAFRLFALHRYLHVAGNLAV